MRAPDALTPSSSSGRVLSAPPLGTGPPCCWTTAQPKDAPLPTVWSRDGAAERKAHRWSLFGPESIRRPIPIGVRFGDERRRPEPACGAREGVGRHGAARGGKQRLEPWRVDSSSSALSLLVPGREKRSVSKQFQSQWSSPNRHGF
ncbi:hypothetical protein GPALN_004201 [Globodera pallida]|nr:hypothetical protein GPALN_004201 [Globodera pallida]